MESIQELIEFYKNFWKQSKAAADRYRANTKLKYCREGLIKEMANLECYAGFINHLTALEKKIKISSHETDLQSGHSGQLHKHDVGGLGSDVGGGEQLCLACHQEPATRGIGDRKTVCSKCWNIAAG